MLFACRGGVKGEERQLGLAALVWLASLAAAVLHVVPRSTEEVVQERIAL